MRKAALKTFLILALGAMIFASLFSFVYAFADDATAETEYPETFRFDLELEGVTDYAIDDNGYIFASSEGVTTVRGENMARYGFEATNVDISEGVFYCSNGGVTFYSEDGATWTSCDGHGFDEPLSSLYVDDIIYNVVTGSGISIYNLTTDEIDRETLSGFSLMKECGEKLYAVCDDCLYEIDGYDATEVEISYTDYSAADGVSTGTASLSSWSETLENPDNLSFEVGTLAEGAFISEIDLASIFDETFDVFDTFEVTESSSPAAGDQVLILCRSGNAYVVAAGLSVYILRCEGVENVETALVSTSEGSGTVSEPTLCSYLIPVICDAVAKDDLDSVDGSKVQICGFLSAEDYPFLYCDFYLVSYETEGVAGYGFVPERYVTIGSFGEALTEFDDEDFSDDNYILTVVLILIVIALVLVAAGYIVFIATRSKKKGKAGEDETDEIEEDRDEDE